MKKRILSLLLAVVMVALAIPAAVLPALAADGENGATSLDTRFSLLDNFVLSGRETWATTKATNDLFTNTGAWQAGIYNVTFDASKIGADKEMEEYLTIGTTFSPYNAINSSFTSNGNGFFFLEASGKGGSFQSRAMYIQKQSELEGGWGVYLTTGLDYGWSSATPKHNFTGYTYAPAVRYTVPYSGNVKVTVDGNWYHPLGEGYQYLIVRVNGKTVQKIVHENKDVLVEIPVSVKAGDTVEFVSAIDPILSSEYSQYDSVAADKWAAALSDISKLRRGFRIDGIDIEFVSATPEITSTFNVTENFVLGNYETWKSAKPTVFNNSGAWQAGLSTVTFNSSAIAANTPLNQYLTVNKSFLTFNTITSWSGGEFFLERTDYSGGGRGSRAFYFVTEGSKTGGWGVYLCTGLNYDWTSSGAGIVDYSYAPTLRYVAPYGGELTVDLDGGWYSSYGKGYQHLWVRHNDTVYDIVNEGTNVSKTYTFNVKKGDVIEFISVIDPVMSKEYNSLDSNAAATWNPSSTASLRRGFRIDNIDVTYTSVANESKWVASSAISSNALSTSSSMVRFFQWFKDGSTTPLAIGSTLDSTCVAKINPDLITAGVISADDTLAVAYEKFCEYLKKNAEIVSNNKDWSFGNVKSDGTYTEIKYFAFYHGRSLLLGNSSVQYANADGNGYHAPLADWNKMMTTIMSDLKSKAGLTDGDVVSGIEVPFSVAGQLTSYTQLTNGSTALGFTSGATFAGYGGNDQAGYRYTAPLDGKLTLTIDSITTAGGYKFRIFVNGVAQADWVAGEKSSAAEIASALSTLGTIDVKAGDTVTIAFERNGGNTFTPNFTATLLADAYDFNTTAALTINDAYGVKMTATPSVAGGKISAFINGAWVEGTLTNGAYTFTLKDGINVSDLTASKNASAAERDGVAVSYQLKEVVNGHTIISGLYETTTDKMLSQYEASANARVAALAKDIRHLAAAAKAAIENPNGSSLEQSEKNYIIKADTPLTALKEAGANVSYTGTAGDFVIASANINMDNRLSMLILISATGNKTLEDLRNGGYYVEAVNGAYSTTALVASEKNYVTVGGNSYIGVLVNVPISMWDQQFAYTIKDAEGNVVSTTLHYSVKDWCIRTYTNSWENKYYVVRAMYNLGNSAAAYKASL